MTWSPSSRRWPPCGTSGVRLSIDDFGTGHASLTYLARFPVDQVKVDRSFVAGLGIDAGSAAIVGGVVGMAHTFDLRVVAEGVETEEQLSRAPRARLRRRPGLPAGACP